MEIERFWDFALLSAYRFKKYLSAVHWLIYKDSRDKGLLDQLAIDFFYNYELSFLSLCLGAV